MTRYIVTSEFKTSKWKKVLRFFKFIKPREDFELVFFANGFTPNEIIISGNYQYKIIKEK